MNGLCSYARGLLAIKLQGLKLSLFDAASGHAVLVAEYSAGCFVYGLP